MCCPSLIDTFFRYLGVGRGLYLDMKCGARAVSEIALLFGGGGTQGRWVLARMLGMHRDSPGLTLTSEPQNDTNVGSSVWQFPFAAPFPSSTQLAALLPASHPSCKSNKTSEVLSPPRFQTPHYHHTLMHHLKHLEIGERWESLQV